MNEKPFYVTFGEKKLEDEYESLKAGKGEDRQLHGMIERAMKGLKKNPACGTKIPKKLWPKEYIRKYRITNLWKQDLARGWRLIYTIQTNEVMVLSIILEWFDHKEYEKRFGYG